MTEYQLKGTYQPKIIGKPNFYGEWQGVFQIGRLLLQFPSLTKIEKGNREKIILIPGWKSPEEFMFPMKSFLSYLNYDVNYWGFGVNKGDVEYYKNKLIESIQKSNALDEKVTLIGWSLGGVIAREVAREIPKIINSVITYGTPVIGGPKYTIGANYWDKADMDRIEKELEELNDTNPIAVPISAIFTKNDNFVSWQASIDHFSKNVKHYKVKSTHTSLGIDPDVFKIVGKHLKENLTKQ